MRPPEFSLCAFAIAMSRNLVRYYVCGRRCTCHTMNTLARSRRADCHLLTSFPPLRHDDCQSIIPHLYVQASWLSSAQSHRRLHTTYPSIYRRPVQSPSIDKLINVEEQRYQQDRRARPECVSRNPLRWVEIATLSPLGFYPHAHYLNICLHFSRISNHFFYIIRQTPTAGDGRSISRNHFPSVGVKFRVDQ